MTKTTTRFIVRNGCQVLSGFGPDGRPQWSADVRQAARWERRFDAETDGAGRVLQHEWPREMDVVEVQS